MLQHVVVLRFDQPLDDADRAEMRAQLQSWRTELPLVRAIRLGQPLYPAMSDGYQYLLYIELDDADALAEYLSHPAHIAFGTWMMTKGLHALVVSYELNHETVIQAR